MFPFRRLLVALSGRDTDCGLLRYAAMLHRTLAGAEILCIHVSGESDSPDLRRNFASRVAELLPGARSEVMAGDILDTILAVASAQRSDLVLLGHSSGRRRRSLARRLGMKAPCSVWIAPGQATPSIRRVLVPFDFSTISADTVSVATALAEAAGLDECLGLHVEFNQAVVTFDEIDEIVAEDRDRAFGLFIAPINLHGVWVKPLFVDSPNVAQTIVRIAVEQACDLIVMELAAAARRPRCCWAARPSTALWPARCRCWPSNTSARAFRFCRHCAMNASANAATSALHETSRFVLFPAPSR